MQIGSSDIWRVSACFYSYLRVLYLCLLICVTLVGKVGEREVKISILIVIKISSSSILSLAVPYSISFIMLLARLSININCFVKMVRHVYYYFFLSLI